MAIKFGNVVKKIGMLYKWKVSIIRNYFAAEFLKLYAIPAML